MEKYFVSPARRKDLQGRPPPHRRFEMSITNGSGGVGFMSMVMGGAITASCRTDGDGGRITAGSKTVVTNRR